MLHSIWDTALVLEAMHASLLHDEDIEKYSHRLIKLATQNRADWEKGSVVDWEIAAHELAENITYGELKPTQTVPNLFAALAGPADMKRCSDNHYDRTLYELGLKIDYLYIDHAVNAVELQMAKAGLRLAKMLNETWPEPLTHRINARLRPGSGRSCGRPGAGADVAAGRRIGRNGEGEFVSVRERVGAEVIDADNGRAVKIRREAFRLGDFFQHGFHVAGFDALLREQVHAIGDGHDARHHGARWDHADDAGSPSVRPRN